MRFRHQLKTREQAAREYLAKCVRMEIERRAEAERAIELLAWGICGGFALIIVLAFLT